MKPFEIIPQNDATVKAKVLAVGNKDSQNVSARAHSDLSISAPDVAQPTQELARPTPDEDLYDFTGRLAVEAQRGPVAAVFNYTEFNIPQGVHSSKAIETMWREQRDENTRKQREKDELRAARREEKKTFKEAAVFKFNHGEKIDEFSRRLAPRVREGDVEVDYAWTRFIVPKGEYTAEQIDAMYKQQKAANEQQRIDKDHRDMIKRAEKRAHITESKPINESVLTENLDNYTERLAQEAQKGDIRAMWHNIIFDIPQGEHLPDAIVEMWRQRSREEHQEYLQSPKGMVERKKLADTVVVNQTKIDQLMAELDTIDFSNVRKIFEWCVKLEKLHMPAIKGSMSEHLSVDGTQIDGSSILLKFAEHGYVPIRNDGKGIEGFDRENKDMVAKAIIGDALDCIQRGTFLPSAIRPWYDEWKRKFGKRIAKAKST